MLGSEDGLFVKFIRFVAYGGLLFWTGYLIRIWSLSKKSRHESEISPNTVSDQQTVEGAGNQSLQPKRRPRKFEGARPKKDKNEEERLSARPMPLPEETSVIIFFSTLTGRSEKYATQLYNALGTEHFKQVRTQNIDYVDLDEHFVTPSADDKLVYLFVLPSYETESPLDYFFSLLRDTHNDFRVDAKPLSNIAGYAVVGLGDSYQYPGKKFCYQALEADRWLATLGGRRLAPAGKVDVSKDNAETFGFWASAIRDVLHRPGIDTPELTSDDSIEEDDSEPAKVPQVVDLEDMGNIMKESKATGETKEMVSKDSPTHRALTKQGYTIVGSHSGVKICRWTKSALRGRGSCYKYSFYGIRSHLCMETTPSLACANKCTFCWRHGTNPVGTHWRWKVDPPEVVLKGAMEGHYQKIKQMRGVPGVRMERFKEAMQIRHCALSLVGEPIFYPYINEFVAMLHEREISSFLVTNAQHPDAFERMSMVTQLYVSIDASTKDSLKQVDRPLFRDFWERFLRCIDILREKRQRTVYRLTLVKAFNMQEIKEYADLVKRGRPCFIEIKGVTYCGNSDSSSLTMKNVPYYEDVAAFVEALRDELDSSPDDDEAANYGIAAEHAHSNCILLAQNRFKIDGNWHTHINYSRFFELLRAGKDFGPEDYISPTPDFAMYGNGGFSPDDERWHRNQKA